MNEHLLLPAVAAAHAAGTDAWTLDGVSVRRVTGGNNNALYQVQADGQAYGCKLCVADAAHRAAREYQAQSLLQAAELDLAPQPLWLDESETIAPYPAIAYRWLPGEPIGPTPTSVQLAALLTSYQRLHSLLPDEHPGIPEAWLHHFDFQPYLTRLYGFLDQYGAWLVKADRDGGELRDRLARLADRLAEAIATTTVSPSRDHIQLRICRVDPNLANIVWSGDGRLRWVDWEYSGWGDPALDLAEMRWHVAFISLSEQQHTWLRKSYRRPPGDDSFEERLAVWDHYCATHWAFLMLRALWSAYNGPDRVRLTRIAADPAELRTRLVHFIGRAERVATSRQMPPSVKGSAP